jgi:hypothetical protein
MDSAHLPTNPGSNSATTKHPIRRLPRRAVLPNPSVRNRRARSAGVHHTSQAIPEALLEAVRERAAITDLFPPAELRRRGSEFLTLLPLASGQPRQPHREPPHQPGALLCLQPRR